MLLQLRDKVIGMLIGKRIGDGLGMPLETFDHTVIAERFGCVTDYMPAPAEHKFIPNTPAGTSTDDTQHTLSVVRAFIRSHGHFDMDEIARQHVLELERDNRTWGPTTRKAVQRLAQGVHWSESGKTDRPNSGKGNGVAIKCSPLAAYWTAVMRACSPVPWELIVEWENKLVDFTYMTHYTSLASSSCAGHVAAIRYCLDTNPAVFKSDHFLVSILARAGLSAHGYRELDEDSYMSHIEALNKLRQTKILTDEYLYAQFGNEPFHAENSLGISYGFFIRKPTSIEALYDTVNGGGDADSNGGFVGEMLGALHGPDIFPQHLKDGCKDLQEVIELAEQFCDCLGIM
jgi:ADP-ribosyl-[dinitrogen reductase] hydrolase